MFLMKSGAARKVFLLAAVLALLASVSVAQNLSESSGAASEASWRGVAGGGQAGGVSVTNTGDFDAFNKTDDEPEEVVAVVIDSAQDIADGGAMAFVPRQSIASKIVSYFEHLQAKWWALMAQVSGH